MADFVGSLNALEVEVAEIVGDHCVARFDAGRIVAVAAGATTGSRVRVAVRPERVRIAPREAGDVSDGGSWLAGTVAEIVYLGMLTQYHVTTAAGHVVSHRMNDDDAPRVELGSLVVVAWAAEDTSVLGPVT